MKARLETREGRIIYDIRKFMVEPVIGNIKYNLVFREFLLRGLENVKFEINIASNANNLKKIWKARINLWVNRNIQEIIFEFFGCEPQIKFDTARNTTPERRAEVRDIFGIYVVHSNVGKPFQAPFSEALAYLRTAPKETAIIADQLLTDIAGGNLAGMLTIKVSPLRRFSEPVHHMIAREFETCLLRTCQEEGHAVKTYLPGNYL